jgi:prevent-host-death family protein
MTKIWKHIPVSIAKDRLSALIRELEQSQGAIFLTRNGVPAAVLLSLEHYRGLMETIEILADTETMRSLGRSLKQAERGEWRSRGEVFGEES